MAWGLGGHDHTKEIQEFEDRFQKKYEEYWCIACGEKMSKKTIEQTQGCSLPYHLSHFNHIKLLTGR